MIRTTFGNSGYYGSRFWAMFLVNNTYAGTMRGKSDNVTPIQVPVLKNDKFSLQRRLFNFFPKISAENIFNNITIKANIYHSIINPAISIFPQKGIMKYFML